MSIEAQPPKGFWAKVRWVLTYVTLWMIPLVAIERFADEHYKTGWIFTGLFIANLIIVSVWDPIAGIVSRKGPKMLPMLPIIGMAIGALLLVGCTIWMFLDIRSKQAETSRALLRFVLPRRIDEQGSEAIAEALKKLPSPHVVKFTLPKNDNEASVLAYDLQNAMKAGGWKTGPTENNDDLREGLTLDYQQTQASAQAITDPLTNPVSVLIDALKQAGIRVDSSGSGSGANVTENVLTVRIGRRPRDDADSIINKNIQRSIDAMRKQLRE